MFGKKNVFAAFLEKEDIKLLVYEISGKKATRVFGGQLSFFPDVLREAFIVDPAKFSAQVKLAISQKPQLSEVKEGVLFIHPEKTYIKALPANDSVDSFIRSLPYFKEELVIGGGENLSAGVRQGKEGLITYAAFEKKLVEDLERPFLELGKKVTNVFSAALVCAKAFSLSGRQFILVGFDKEIVVAVVDSGEILETTVLSRDVFVGRLNEFRLGKNYGDIRQGVIVGQIDRQSLDRLTSEQGINIDKEISGDIYDLLMGATLGTVSVGSSGAKEMLPGVSRLSFPKLPEKKFLVTFGAAVVGFVLIIIIGKILSSKGIGIPVLWGNNRIKSPLAEGLKTKTATASPTPAPVPEKKPADFKVRILNGTTVPGEAGKLAESLKAMGFDVVETKNATASGFLATRLRTVAGVPETIIEQIKSSLLKEYESVSLEGLTDEKVDIEVIIGKKK